MTQVNPPFDGSAPCAGCNGTVRELSAYLHNFLTRCDVPTRRILQAKAMTRLWDLRALYIPDTVAVPHPAVEELLNVARALRVATQGMYEEGHTIRWSNAVLDRVEALIPRVAMAADAYEQLRNAHFADARHAQGEVNTLRTMSGSGWAGFVEPDYGRAAYHYTVEQTQEGLGDLTHTVCQSHFILHPHFKSILSGDPTFYARAYCQTCKQTLPWSQFVYHPNPTA